MAKCASIYKTYEEKLGSVFAKHGTLVAKYPWVLLGVCVFVNMSLGLGLIRIESESDAELLYTPKNNQASLDRKRLQELFTDTTTTNWYPKTATDFYPFVDVIIKAKNGDDLLTSAYISAIEIIDTHIRGSIVADVEGSTVNYTSLCAIRNSQCEVGGDIIFTSSFSTQMLANNIDYPIFSLENLGAVFADIETTGGKLTSANIVRLVYYLKGDEFQDASYAWEAEFISSMKTYSSAEFDIVFSASTSLEVELDANTNGDVVFFALTISLMLTYAGVATFGGNCVSNRMMLGQAGVFATVLSILGSFGLMSAIGVKFVNLVGIMPFLLIGIGLDDIFILLSGVADSDPKQTIETRMRHAMRTSGVAITITSITDFLAFAIGASSVFLSVRNFCLYTGVGVLFCYFNQLTFFLPCIVINLRQTQKNKHMLTCKPTKTRQELEDAGKSGCYTYCCGGKPAENRRDNESPLETYPKLLFKLITRNTVGKVIIILVYLGYIGVSVWGCVNLREGLELQNLVKDDSYYKAYLDVFQKEYPARFTLSVNIDQEQTYSSAATQNQISNLVTALHSSEYVDSGVLDSWLVDYKLDASYDDSSEASFISGLKTFLATRSDHRDSVVFDSAETKIIASRFFIATVAIDTSHKRGQLMLRLREITEASSLNSVFVYSFQFVFFEQFVVILSSTLQTVGIAVAAMFVITLLMMPHPVLVLLVLVTMVSILVGVFGFMYVLNLSLSSITMIHLVMSVGFSVDYSAHICHAFISGSEPSRSRKVIGAFDRAGGPIFNATASSMVGILALVFSKSFIFFSFFKLMMMVLLLGLLHAVFLLPVILSLIGPVDNTTSNQLSPSASINGGFIRGETDVGTTNGDLGIKNGKIKDNDIELAMKT